MKFLSLLSITLRKEFINWSRYPLRIGSGILFNVFLGVGLALGLSTLGPIGGNYIIAWLCFGLYGSIAGSVTYTISSQATQGVLQRQLAAPTSSLQIIIANRIVGIIFFLLTIILTIGAALLCDFRFHFDPLLTISVILATMPFFFGMGLAYSGLCLMFKRAENIIGSITLLEMALAFLAATSPPQLLVDIFRWVPYTQMIMLLNRTGTMGVTFFDTASELIPLLISSLALFGIGAYIFSISDRETRRRGTMGQY